MDDFDAEKRLGIVAYGRKTKDTTRKEKKAREEQTKRDHGAANREKKADVLAAIRRRVEELIACGTSAVELATPTREIALMDEELGVAVPAEPAPAGGKTKREKRREKEEREMDGVTVATADGPATLPVVRLHGKDAALDGLVDRYSGMDFEDVVGGQAMRFEYVECPPDDSGLTLQDILTLDDKRLNRLFSLKRVRQRAARKLNPWSGSRANSTPTFTNCPQMVSCLLFTNCSLALLFLFNTSHVFLLHLSPSRLNSR